MHIKSLCDVRERVAYTRSKAPLRNARRARTVLRELLLLSPHTIAHKHVPHMSSQQSSHRNTHNTVPSLASPSLASLARGVTRSLPAFSCVYTFARVGLSWTSRVLVAVSCRVVCSPDAGVVFVCRVDFVVDLRGLSSSSSCALSFCGAITRRVRFPCATHSQHTLDMNLNVSD